MFTDPRNPSYQRLEGGRHRDVPVSIPHGSSAFGFADRTIWLRTPSSKQTLVVGVAKAAGLMRASTSFNDA